MTYFRITFKKLLLLFSSFALFKDVQYSSSRFSQTGYQVKQNFGQNLTEAIDKVLKDGDLTYKRRLTEALEWSTSVYYESDILLNDIENVIPVLDLLNEVRPDRAFPPTLTLSLNYLNKTTGQFNWNRINDIYYSLEKNVTEITRSKLMNSISIVINFVPTNQKENERFSFVKIPSRHLFVSYIKNFVKLYFGRGVIPVGIMYDKHFPNEYKLQQSPTADFLIYYTRFDFINNFPRFIDTFTATMTSDLRSVPQLKTSIIIDGVEGPRQFKSYLWAGNPFNFIENAVVELPQYQNISEKFVSQFYERVTFMFNYIVLAWANMEIREVILDKPMKPFNNEIFTASKVREKLILPNITMEEIKVGGCSLKNKVSKWNEKYETVILDEKTWRTFARFKSILEENVSSCDTTLITNTQNQQMTKVLMHFTDGIVKEWRFFEKHMRHLVLTYPKISQMYLDTILFSEKDLKASKEIQSFANFTGSTYKVGCVIDFDSIQNILVGSGNSFKIMLENALCKPIFPKVNVLIWRVSTNAINSNKYSSITNEFYSAYTSVFLTREIFQRQFPTIKVVIQFPPINDQRLLATIFDGPLIVTAD